MFLILTFFCCNSVFYSFASVMFSLFFVGMDDVTHCVNV